MTDIYQGTDDISVFPSAKRSQAKPEQRLLSEKNIVGLVNKLLDNESFVIRKDNSSIQFSINGYYFECTDSRVLGTAPLYAKISLTNGELDGQDVDGDYEGVAFSDSADQGEYTYVLQLLDSNGNVPKDSDWKYSIDKVKGSIDCGVIS